LDFEHAVGAQLRQRTVDPFAATAQPDRQAALSETEFVAPRQVHHLQQAQAQLLFEAMVGDTKCGLRNAGQMGLRGGQQQAPEVCAAFNFAGQRAGVQPHCAARHRHAGGLAGPQAAQRHMQANQTVAAPKADQQAFPVPRSARADGDNAVERKVNRSGGIAGRLQHGICLKWNNLKVRLPSRQSLFGNLRQEQVLHAFARPAGSIAVSM